MRVNRGRPSHQKRADYKEVKRGRAFTKRFGGALTLEQRLRVLSIWKRLFGGILTLNLPEDVRFLLKDVHTKVATNSTRDFIRIYLFSTHLLQKKRFMS